MTFQPAGPGKTAPKLFQDFLLFDPYWGNPNILVDHSPPQGEGRQLAPPLGCCSHEYTTKFTQSVLPPLDLRHSGNSIYKLAVICKKCRIHAEIHVDHSNSTNSCPTNEHPLHHFQRVAALEKQSSVPIRYAWQCSVEECHATLFIFFRPPVIKNDVFSLLTDPELLKTRYDALVKEDPNREGIRQATRSEPLQRLRKYICDSLNPEHHKRQFPSHNKRFQEAFGLNGKDCADLLEQLGFEFEEETWTLPDPPQIHDRLQADGSSHRELLENVEIELLACMFKLSSEHSIMNPAAEEGWSSANRDIERTLAAQGYTRHVASRRGPPSNAELPFFNSLGALPDFGDSLIEYTYDRQILCDPERTPYYFECLQTISESRNTEQLQMKVATLSSQDIVSRRDITAAYRFLNITPVEAQTIDDATIINRFQAQQSDLGAQAQAEAKIHLYKLGCARNSGLLMNAANQSVETYEDALSWLSNGVTKDTDDETILAVLAVRTADSKADEEIGQKAISVIARERKSQVLNNFLLSGRSDGYTMSVEEALRHLGINDPIEKLDKDVIQGFFQAARIDRPGETTNKACAIVWQAMTADSASSVTRSPENWPVGLTSHGNTCYLNSLLQYYFSIKPLRNIVLDYDEYKLDTSKKTEKEAKVGRLKVSLVEIKGGQRFAQDMKSLFQRMIHSPNMTVKPDENLVCRAFLKPKDYQLLDPMDEDEKPKGGDHAMVNGIVEDNADNNANLIDGQVLASPSETLGEETQSSEASSVTLQASVNGEDADVSMKNTEMPPTPPASPGLKAANDATSQMEGPKPPLPPRRRFSTTKEEALEKAKENARRQQDVTEVHDAAMWRLRCGMTPKGQDEDSEQEDDMRDLFSMAIEQKIFNDGDLEETKLLSEPHIILDVPYQDTDVYSALDAVFDLQPYGNKGEKETFKSITNLPPLVQINMPRIGYEGYTAFKSTAYMHLEDELYLDRYFSQTPAAGDIMPKRRKCWGWRKRLHTLKLEQKALSQTALDLDGPTVVGQTADYLTSLDGVNRDLQSIGVGAIDGADGEITEKLSIDAEEQAARIRSLESEIELLQKNLNAEFAEHKSIKYRLAAVFFHRGQHGHGHYWIYIHDFANKMWRMYNDERVEEFNKPDEIFDAKTFNHGTPTYAVYVDAEKLDTVQPVCRDPEKVSEPETLAAVHFGQQDIQMGNTGSQKDSFTATVDPKLVTEGNDKGWDEPRQVIDGTKCIEIKRLDSFSFEKGDEDCKMLPGIETIVDAVEEGDRDRSGRSVSPGKRHGPEMTGNSSPEKRARVDSTAWRTSKFTEVFSDFEWDSPPSLDLDSGSYSPPPALTDLDFDEDAHEL